MKSCVASDLVDQLVLIWQGLGSLPTIISILPVEYGSLGGADGELVSDNEVGGGGPRGAFASQCDCVEY